MSEQQSKTYPKTLYTFSAYFPLTIFLISFSLFSRSKIIHIKIQYLIANLTENRIVQLEEA